MVRIFRHYVSPVKLVLALTDFFVIFGAALLAEWLRYTWIDLPYSLDVNSALTKVLFPIFVAPALLGVGGYQSDAIRDMRVFAIRLFIALVATSIALAAFLYLVPSLAFWRSILLLAVLLSGIGVLLVHGTFLLFADQQFLSRRVMILGADEEATELKSYVERAKEAGLFIVATIALPNQDVVASGARPLKTVGALDHFARANEIELIIIANESHPNLPTDALISCRLAGIEIRDRLTFFEQVRGYVELASVRPEWIIFSDGFRGGNGIEKIFKRILDILISSVMLVLTAPITLIAAIMVATTSRGPVFYSQERVGLDGRKFLVHKFRSMKQDAEKEGRPEWAKTVDPRVTLIGGFLRRTRIDELPQLINVLGGSMSFVGPRPERPYFVDQLKKEISLYRERHSVKPGITGWAQIQYPYGASFEDSKRKLEYDLYYIKNYSVFLDLLIILQTIRVVLFPISVR